MNISYDYYRIFYYVAKYGSFTKAANMLLCNQPNLSRAIKVLEAELGCTLFERTHKGVRATPEGEMLYAHIALAFEHIQAGESEVSQNKSLQKGLISLGATEIALRCYLLPILNEYRKKYPNIKIKISNLSTPQAISALQNGLVDFAVVTSPVTEYGADVAVKELCDFEDVAVCGDAFYADLCERTMTLQDLSAYPLVSLGKGGASYAFYADLFSRAGMNYSPDVEAATTDQILPLVRHNLGIGFVPCAFLQEEPIGVFPIALSTPIPSRHVCLATKKGHSLSLPAGALKGMLEVKDSHANCQDVF